MRKPKDLWISEEQRAVINVNEILIYCDYRKLTPTNAKRLGKWLLKASEYVKNRKEKIDTSGYLP